MWTIVERYPNLVGRYNGRGEYYLGAIHCSEFNTTRLIFGCKPDSGLSFEVDNFAPINFWVDSYRVFMEELALASSLNSKSEYTLFHSAYEDDSIVREKIQSIEWYSPERTLYEVVNNLKQEIK